MANQFVRGWHASLEPPYETPPHDDLSRYEDLLWHSDLRILYSAITIVILSIGIIASLSAGFNNRAFNGVCIGLAVVGFISFAPKAKVRFKGYDVRNDEFTWHTRLCSNRKVALDLANLMLYRNVSADFRAHPVYITTIYDRVAVVYQAFPLWIFARHPSDTVEDPLPPTSS